MKGKRIPVLLAVCLILCLLVPSTAMADEADGMNMYQNSDFIEKEQPELSAETKWLIAQYQQEPNEASYLELREMVIGNYNAVLTRKEDKLAELKTETAGKPGGEEIVAEMEALVQEMYVTYWDRINASMLRFTDPRLLKWKTSQAARYDYIPVMGAGESIYIKRTPVTNAEYAAYLDATGAQAPSNWTDGTFPEGEEDYPVNCVSYQDAEAYCAWLTQIDGFNSYRLPSESEWELAAGHMPKDADFNCGVSDGRTPVEQYADVTRGAHGAVDFWGNVWEWTSTVRSESDGTTVLAVKGGSWASERTDCRTEYRGEGRDATGGYEDVGFRVIQVLNAQEPAQAVDVTALDAADVSAEAVSSDAIALSWQMVEGAVEYQIFECSLETGLLQMLTRTGDTSITVKGLLPATTYGFIVQPISYTATADVASPENCATATTFAGDDVQTGATAFARRPGAVYGHTAQTLSATPAEDSTSLESTVVAADGLMALKAYDGMAFWLYTPSNAREGMPLIVYLHGVTGKGDDPKQLLESEDFVQWLVGGQFGDLPAYVLIPQLPSRQKDWIAAADSVVGMIRLVAEECAVDEANISLSGFSMGGAGTWFLGATHADLFARIAPLSGGIKPTERMTTALCGLPIRAFVGSADTVISPQSTGDCAALLTERGADIEVTEYEGAGHTDVPEKAYLESDLLLWLTGGE